MAHYDCSCCGESFGISHEHCPRCQDGGCTRARREQAPSSKNVMGWQVCTSAAKSLVTSLINDLRVMSQAHVLKDIESGDFEYERTQRGRYEAVIVVHATGVVTFYEGWSIRHDDIPELLASRVLKHTQPLDRNT